MRGLGFHSGSKQELGTVKHGVLFHAEVCDFQLCSFREVGWVLSQDFGEFDEVFLGHCDVWCDVVVDWQPQSTWAERAVNLFSIYFSTLPSY
jgi:hypothetical protein